MTEPCNCTTNPNPHSHNFVRPRVAAAATGRPFDTIESWRKSGALPQTGDGYGQRRVCACCALELDAKSSTRWVKRNKRTVGRTLRAKARSRARSAAA